MTIPCFWLEPTSRAKLVLRRYAGIQNGQPKCPGRYGYHNANVQIDEIDAERDDGGRFVGRRSSIDDSVPRDDPRWPKKCDGCDYEFTDRQGDFWQVNADLVYERLDTHERMTRHEAIVTPGAMFDAWWYNRDDRPKRNTYDPVFLVVVCPSNKYGAAEWLVDGKASNGPGWDRSGVANSATPTVTANPSIGIGDGNSEYHGWLRNGQLVDA